MNCVWSLPCPHTHTIILLACNLPSLIQVRAIELEEPQMGIREDETVVFSEPRGLRCLCVNAAEEENKTHEGEKKLLGFDPQGVWLHLCSLVPH